MFMRILHFAAMVVLLTCMTACSSDKVTYAPVTDIETIEHIPTTGKYRVMPGDTLYSIAWRYGLDYRYVASRNQIAPPYHIEADQIIYLSGQSKPTVTSPQATAVVVKSEQPMRAVAYWRWPARGSVIGAFSSLNKGINIGGRSGDPIYATAAGRVVYSGSGLRGYGKLIIIKHNSTFLTAYAHNSIVLVKEGEWVKPGQKIAEMGKTGAQRVMLHFEIRRNGKPVDPLRYLNNPVIPRLNRGIQ